MQIRQSFDDDPLRPNMEELEGLLAGRGTGRRLSRFTCSQARGASRTPTTSSTTTTCAQRSRPRASSSTARRVRRGRPCHRSRSARIQEGVGWDRDVGAGPWRRSSASSSSCRPSVFIKEQGGVLSLRGRPDGGARPRRQDRAFRRPARPRRRRPGRWPIASHPTGAREDQSREVVRADRSRGTGGKRMRGQKGKPAHPRGIRAFGPIAIKSIWCSLATPDKDARHSVRRRRPLPRPDRSGEPSRPRRSFSVSR